MKKILITTGITLLLLLTGAWAYLLLAGTPQSVQETFSNLGFGNPTPIEPVPIEQPAQLAMGDQRLVQLTTRSIAGFIHISNLNRGGLASTTPVDAGRLRYAERGTGHIYEIELESGTETRVSGATTGQTVGAYFSPDGNEAVLVKETGDTVSSSWHAFAATGEKSVPLPPNSGNFHFNRDGELLFGVSDNEGTTVYNQPDSDASPERLWRIPFSDIDIVWTASSTLVINRPAPHLKGGVYEIVDGELTRLITPRYNLSAVTSQEGRYILYTQFDSEPNAMVSYLYDRDTSQSTAAALPAIPEKCTFIIGSGLWCTVSFELLNASRESLTDWYRGEFISSDTVWKQSESGDTAEYVDYLFDMVGFDVDVTDLTVSADGKTLFFRNKINDTLWMYKIEG